MVLEYAFRRRRAADIAHADEQHSDMTVTAVRLACVVRVHTAKINVSPKRRSRPHRRTSARAFSVMHISAPMQFCPYIFCRLVVATQLAGICSRPRPRESRTPNAPAMFSWSRRRPTSIHFNDRPGTCRSPLAGRRRMAGHLTLAGRLFLFQQFIRPEVPIRLRRLHVRHSARITRTGISKLTGGVLYGYKEPYEDKLPYQSQRRCARDHSRVSDTSMNRFNAQVNLLGAAGLMFTFGYDLLR